MSLSNTQREEMRAATLEAAIALVDDLNHIRTVLSKPDPTPGDVRRLSAQLRRILVERDLAKVATPRIGRIFLTASDLKPVYVSNRSNPIPYFAAAGVEIFGVFIAAAMVERGGKTRPLQGYSPDAIVLLRLDNFMAQRVICFEGEWIRRLDIIKYIANIAHGVHSGTIKEPVENLIRRVRHVSRMSVKDGTPLIENNFSIFSTFELPVIVDRKHIDCVLIEVFATASHLVNSPDVLRLEKIISAEVDE